MTDITILRDSELMVAGVTGETGRGIDFVDFFLPPDAEQMVVVDSGRIVVHLDIIDFLIAKAEGLAITDEVIR